MRTYSLSEMFASIQGEGFWAGRRAVFVRLAHCNLWSGREADRASATCRFCDTDFAPRSRMTAIEICREAAALWGDGRDGRFVVLTGGEPSLQVDHALVAMLKRHGFEAAMETNGTRRPPALVDWITVSPKAGAALAVDSGDELKVVWPQEGLDMDGLAALPFAHRFVQPMAGAEGSEAACLEMVRADPRWRLSLQVHKILGLR
jgi:7-carboxy-7-deazaguanine synthase (Cx14CxxC type)